MLVTVVVLQPGYIPWLGFFDQIRRADIFVYYDDVQFDANGWRNRNRIRAGTAPMWLTVPVIHEFGQAISAARIDNSKPWARKHLRSIEQWYRKAPHFGRYFDELAELYARPWDRLLDLDVAVVARLAHWLDLKPPSVFSSQLGIGGRSSERLLDICRHFGATRYFSGAAARDYLDVALFRTHGIAVEWQDYQHPLYSQMGEGFISHLSALDLILNEGPKAAKILQGSTTCVAA